MHKVYFFDQFKVQRASTKLSDLKFRTSLRRFEIRDVVHGRDQPEHMSGPTVNQPLSEPEASPNCTSVTGNLSLSVR